MVMITESSAGSINNYKNDIIETALMAFSALSYLPNKKHDEKNTLLDAANPILLKIYKLRQMSDKENNALVEIQEQLIRSIQKFEYTLKMSGIPAFLILVLRYILCSVVDESILMSAWGREVDWSRHSMLSIFHQDTRGGEVFFLLLKKMQELPEQNIDILEFMYVCLNLGFHGRYQILSNGEHQIQTLTKQLYEQIRKYRMYTAPQLSEQYQQPKITKRRSVQFKAAAAISCAALLAIFLGLKVYLVMGTHTVNDKINILNSRLLINDSTQSHWR